jgi:hypothetical protein
MNVAQLIAELLKLPQDAEVRVVIGCAARGIRGRPAFWLFLPGVGFGRRLGMGTLRHRCHRGRSWVVWSMNSRSKQVAPLRQHGFVAEERGTSRSGQCRADREAQSR